MSIDDGRLKGARVGLKLELGPKLKAAQPESAPSPASAAANGSFSRRTHSPFFSSQPADLGGSLGSVETDGADEQSNKMEKRMADGGQRSELTLFPQSADLCGGLSEAAWLTGWGARRGCGGTLFALHGCCQSVSTNTGSR